MRKLTFARNRAFYTYCRFAITIILLTTLSLSSWSQCTPQDNSISGTVFEDIVNDGNFGNSDAGLSNVLVTVYDNNGNAVNTAVSDVDGHYTVDNLPNGGEYMVVFTGSSSFYPGMMGEDNRSSVQFVQSPQCDVNYGMTRATAGCGTNPDIALTCFVQGTVNENSDLESIISLEYGFSPTSPVTKIASHGQTGSVWGIVHNPKTEALYSAAFVKQYSGLKYTPYTILKTELTGAKSTSAFVDVNDLIPQNLPGLTVTDVNDCAYGNQVGRVGLGSLLLSPDNDKLYTAVLDEGLVVEIDVANPSPSTTEVFTIPTPADIDPNEEFRIFALAWKDDVLYVGGTITGSYSQDKKVSAAVVMTLDPKSGLAEEIFRTNYIQGFWQDTQPASLATSHWLTDIDFTSTGEMMISLTDRIGHRFCKASTNRLDQQFPDLLMVGFNNDTQEWELENNGSINGRAGSGVGNGQGPGGGEFFGFDFWPTNPTYHSETALGSVFLIPGSDEVVVSVYDPMINSYSGGLHRYSTTDGSKTGAIELYTHNTDEVFGKATGFGDITGVCSIQSIEIGNYVWNDANGNGLQDPGESGLENVGLNLYNSNCELIGSTTTNALGMYAFNETNVDADGDGIFEGVFSGTTYYVEIDDSIYDEVTGLYTIGNEEFTICAANSGTLGDDIIDCDAEYDQTACLSTAFIEVNTQNTDHTFDIGLGAPSGFDLALKKEIVGNQFAKVGEEMVFMITVYNQGGSSASKVTISDYLTDGYSFDPDQNNGWELIDGVLVSSIEQKLLPGQNVSKILRLTVTDAISADYINYAEISEALDLSGGVAQDVDSTPDSVQDNDNGGVPDSNTDDQLNGDGEVDEDDHDPAVPRIFDLAVKMTLADDKFYYSDDLVKFDIKVYNQGNVAADFIQLVNYFPEDLALNADLNDGWDLNGFKAYIKDNTILEAGEVRDYCIYFDVVKGIVANEVQTFIEIAESSPVGHPGSFDFDSTPDDLDDNDKGGFIYTSTDNQIDDHGTIDEDDHDPVVIKSRYVDLALMKTTEKTGAKPGDNVTFFIDVINQGSAVVYSLDIIDYIPEFMTLNDDNWQLLPDGNAMYSKELEDPLYMGQKTRIEIVLKIDEDVSPRTFINYAEIVGAKSEDNTEIGEKDIDSSPDMNEDNDNGGIAGSSTDDSVNSDKDIDEDDHDPARVSIIESMLESSECLENATNSTDGQFEDAFKVTGPAGETWYVFEAINYFDVTSPDPADGPLVELVVGEMTTMDEMPIDADLSMYTFSAIRLDGKEGFISFRNLDTDDIETITVPAMMYEDIVIEGDQALCEGQTKTYCVANPDPALMYAWDVSGGATFIDNGDCIEVDWSTVPADADYEVSVAADSGCNVPATITVSIGTSSGAMSCLNHTNLSLDGDCEVKVTPQLILTSDILPGQAYGVMLTTESGEVIPNATLTSEHIGTTVTVKVMDGCSGNNCWGTIFVEDKIKPIIICEDAFISCNKVDEFGGPFAEDNCGNPVEVILLNETYNYPQCDDYSAEIYRQYQAIDAYGNKSEICEMTVFVELIDLDDIVFPDDFTMMDGTALNCDAYDLDMDGVADTDITGVPTYNGEYVYPDFDPLCNTALTFEDDIRFINGVKKIKRTWTAWNWYCSSTITREYEQFIEVRDVDAPEITCPEDITISASQGNCEGVVSLPLPDVSDSCSDEITIQTITQITSVIEEGDSRIVTFPYSDSPYIITYRATDAAGNSAECEMTVTVVDDIAPIAICDQNTIVGLNSLGEGYLYAMNLDDGSYDACQLTDMKIRRVDENGLFADKVLFTCDDLGAPVMVELKVYDAGGLSNSCMANVIVQDKHAPEADDLPDVTIECGTDFTPLSQFGEFTFTDACNVTTVEDSIISLNSCGTGTITRTFVVSDSEGSDMATQVITVVNSDPFEEADIVSWPEDFEVTITECEDDQMFHPDNLAVEFAYPIWNDDSCDQVSAGYHDEVYPLINDPESICYKIVRTWTIIDWCQLDMAGDPLEFNDIQIIKVKNTKKPDPIVVEPELDNIVSDVCDTGILNFTATSDDCNPDLLTWMIQIDLDQDFLMTGVYDITRTGFGPEANLFEEVPQGTHDIVYSFSNGCGNTETTSRTVTISNNIPPAILCLSKTSIGLGPWNLDDDPEPETEAACVYVDTLAVASGTFHPCGTPFELSFSADSIVKTMCFDCNDIGINLLTIYAIDIYGNISSCNDTLEVQDNNDIDICIDVKDCTTGVIDTTISLESGCFVFVDSDEYDITQISEDCGDLTITNNLTGTSTLNGAVLNLGLNEIIWTITNGSLTSECPQEILVIDEIDPTISCSPDLGVTTSEFTGCEYTHVGSGLDPTFSDNCNIADVYHDYISAPSLTTLAGAVFPIGVTVVTWTVEDEAGNSDQCTVTITVTDDEMPTITCAPDATFNDSDDGSLDCSHTVVDGSLDPTVSDECSAIASVTHNYGAAPSNTTLAGATFEYGTTVVIFTATDAAGNTATCEVEITVEDDFPPSITCAPDLQIGDTGDGDLSCNHTITNTDFDPVSATDNCNDFIVTHDYGAAPFNTTLNGATFPEGATIVTWTITDNGGAGLSSTCTLTITVFDDVDPTCVDQPIIPLTIAAGDEVVLDISLLPNPYTDNCEIASYTFDPAVLDCSNAGIVDVTVTVTDESGNDSDCPVQFDITVQDSLSCSFNIDTVYLDINGEAVLIAEDIVDVSGGLCDGDLTPSLSQTSFLCNDISLSPIDITIFVNGDSCGVGSLNIVDTIGPEIFCSPISVSCLDFENLFNGSLTELLNQTEATDSIWDNCVATLMTETVIDSSALNECNYGILTRTTIAIDPLSGLSDTCVQEITIEGPADPLTQDDVDGILPDTVIINECVVGDFEIDTIAVSDLENLVDCGVFGISYGDISISDGCPDTIIRTYTIDAICQEEIFQFVQVVVINDDIDPTIEEIADTSVVIGMDCVFSLEVDGLTSASDDCTPSDLIGITYSIDGEIQDVTDGLEFTEVGDFVVTATAADGCGNTASTDFNVSITDTIPLEVLCHKVIAFIDTTTLLATVPAIDNVNILGNCDNEASIYVTYDSLDLDDTVRILDCDAINVFTPVDIYVWQIINGDTIPFDLVDEDTTAVINTCKGEIEVQDPFGACPTTILEINGQITTFDGNGIPNYSLALNGSGTDPVFSNQEGKYAFPDMPFGGSYNVSTYNNDNVMNGVSTLDMILIQRHILGLTPFDNPYKYIAADINNSENITGSDLVELRKMILGIYSEFPNNMSWRSVDANYVFPDPTNPWVSQIPEGYKIPSLEEDMLINFIGVKVGDIDGNVNLNVKGDKSSSTRSNETKVLMIEKLDNSSTLNVSADEDLDIAGLQFTIEMKGMKISDITSDIFNQNEIGLYEKADGVYNISIAGTDISFVESGEVLFEVLTDCQACNLNASTVRLTNQGLENELYINETLETVGFEFNVRNIEDESTFAVYQNNPNPWTNTTEIEIALSSAQDVTVKVYDVNGRLINTNTSYMNAGRNSVRFDNQQVKGSGVFYYEVSTATRSERYKMIKLN